MRATAWVSSPTAPCVWTARSVASRATLAEAAAWRSTSEMVAPSSSDAAATALIESRTLKIELTAEWARLALSVEVAVRIEALCSRWLDAFSTPRIRPEKSRLKPPIRFSISVARVKRARAASSCSSLMARLCWVTSLKTCKASTTWPSSSPRCSACVSTLVSAAARRRVASAIPLIEDDVLRPIRIPSPPAASAAMAAMAAISMTSPWADLTLSSARALARASVRSSTFCTMASVFCSDVA